MFCPSCGKRLAEGQVFCTDCGARVPTASAPRPLGGATAPPLAVPPIVEYAGFWRRFAAFIIDNILLSIVTYPLSFIVGFGLGSTGDEVAAIIGVSVFVIILVIGEVLYFALMESSSKQATLGKMALGIIVTDGAGRRISFGKAIGRLFAKILSGIILYIGYIMIAFTEKKQGLHDMIVDTLVVLK